MPARFATFTGYLARHGLSNVFSRGRGPGPAFDRRVAETDYPPAVDAVGADAAGTMGRGSGAWTSGLAGQGGSAGTG